jgi:Flp pilus assembly protein TadG
MTRTRFSGCLIAFARARSGVAAVEFAILVPVLLLLYLGGFEITQALSTYRKLTDTTTELASIVSQYAAMSSSDVTSVFTASSQIMAPNSTSSLTIVLSEVTTDANSNPTVTWSQAYNGATALAVGSSVAMPTGLAMANTSYVLVQTAYLYTPVIGAAYVKPISLHNQIYMLPRRSTSIAYSS